MSSILGNIFKYITWGESHGKAIGAVVEGVPAGIDLNEEYIQFFLNQRKPGSSIYTSSRSEEDKIEILSGLFDGKTTGSPISLIIYNKDPRSKDYSEIENKYRPGHADYVYHKKYGNYDYRGGGRASARETAMRVAVGAIARKILPENIEIKAALTQIGELKVNEINFEIAKNNELFCPDINIIEEWKNYLHKIKEDGSSIGGIIEVRASNVPLGLGRPIYNKLDADLASAFMSINAVKAVEIGLGFNSSLIRGEKFSDEMESTENTVYFHSNNNGGISAGISTGQEIIVRFAVKPTSSINIPLRTITKDKQNTIISTNGRHDPCAAIRAVPIGEAMMAIILADHFLLRKTEI